MSTLGRCEYMTAPYLSECRAPGRDRYLVQHDSEVGAHVGPQFFIACPQHTDDLQADLIRAGFVILDGPL